MSGTARGLLAYQALSSVLAPHNEKRTVETLSKLARLTSTLNRLGIECLNGDARHLYPDFAAWDRALNDKVTKAEHDFQALVDRLPETVDGPISCDLHGDPRGQVATLLLPGQSGIKTHNTLGDSFMFPLPTRKRR